MPVGFYANVTVHVLAAMVWLGGMVYLGVVGAPLLRGRNLPSFGSSCFIGLGCVPDPLAGGRLVCYC